jgi:hypothetical protein
MRLRLSTLLLFVSITACRTAAPPEAPKGEGVDEATKRILTTKDFPFCQPTEAAMPPWGREWCKIQDDATTCPQLKEMCSREWGDKSSRSSSSGAAGKGGASKSSKPKSELREGDSGGAFDRLNFELPAIRGLSFVMWVVIGILLALIIAVVVRAVLARQKTDEQTPEEEDEAPAPAALEYTDPGLGEVALLLRRAREAADQNVAEALALLYAAALRHLEDRGHIQWDVAATNRHYVRTIRGKTPLDAPVAELVREVERVKFGHDAPRRSVFDALYQRIASVLTRAATVLLLALSLSGCGDYGNPGLNGHAAFNELLKSQGVQPTRFSLPIERLSADGPPVLLDTRRLPIEPELLHSIEKALLAGGRILMLVEPGSRWSSWPNLEVTEEGKPGLKPSSDWARAVGIDATHSGALPRTLKITMGTKERDLPDVLITSGGEPFAVRWRSDAGELVVVADRELFANASLAVPANASLVFGLAKEVLGDRKELAEAMLGPTSGADSPTTSLNRAGVLPLMLQALLVLGCLFAARGMAFGRLRDRAARTRRAFSEHVSALGLQFSRHRGSRFAASLFASYALERLWQRTGREAERNDPVSLAKAVAPRAQLLEADVFETLRKAEALRRDPNGVPVPDADLSVIRQLTLLLNRIDPAAKDASTDRRAS